MSASFIACGFQPRPEFVAMFMDTAAGYMQLCEQQCLAAEQAFRRSSEAKRVGRRGGLIEVWGGCCLFTATVGGACLLAAMWGCLALYVRVCVCV